MKIIFMGTPDFAREVLLGLSNSKHEILSVYTGEDKPQNRGHKIVKNPVATLAEEKGYKIYQPKTLRDKEVIESVINQNADVIIVAAYGKILPKEILNGAKYGAINVHGSLLPKYRGAAPIQWAVLNGDKETGITIMQMSEGLDCGDILYVEKIAIKDKETSGQLFDRMSSLGASALLNALNLLEEGKLSPIPQNEDDATYAPMLKKEDSKLNFSLSANEVKNKIYGLQPWPSAKTKFCNTDLKILDCEIAQRDDLEIGEVATDNKEIIIGCGNNTSIKILRLQKMGKGPVSAKEFLNGFKPSGKIFAE
jgi:methionyl-tRNA formyltransferase